jgi:hypothetical protein
MFCHLESKKVSIRKPICNTNIFVTIDVWINVRRVLFQIVETKKFKCKICDERFTQKFSLNVHIASIHEGKEPFKCDICSQIGQLNRRDVSVHHGEKAFKCDKSDYSCSQKGKMKFMKEKLFE